MKIHKLASQDALVATDLIPIGSNAAQDDRRVTAAALLAFIQANLETGDDSKLTEYAAPSSSPATITLANTDKSRWLIITPTVTIGACTIVLPAAANCADRQEILINTTHELTDLTITCAGGNVTGPPNPLEAEDHFTLRYDAGTTTWYCVS
jgi:hypothetical protein